MSSFPENVAELERQLAEERARLDWVEQNCSIYHTAVFIGPGPLDRLNQGRPLREAIDKELKNV